MEMEFNIPTLLNSLLSSRRLSNSTSSDDDDASISEAETDR